MYMLSVGQVNLLDSDCHNMDSRPHRLGETSQHIAKKLDRSTLRHMNKAGMRLLKDEVSAT